MNTTNDQLIELRADGALAVLTFTVGDSSKLTKKFLSELSTALTAGPKKPLLIANDRQLIAVYRHVPKTSLRLQRPDANLELFKGTFRRFTDAEERSSNHLKFNVTNGVVTLPERGSWAAGRTLDNTTRSMLPVFDSPAVSLVLSNLVESWAAAGSFADMQTWAEKALAEHMASQPKVATEEETVAAYAERGDAEDMDQANPMRRLLGKIRAYRKEHGLDRVNPDPRARSRMPGS